MTIETSVPDVVGLLGDEAKQLLSAEGYGVKFETGGGSVWEPSNWNVDSQDPVSGTPLSPGTTVTLVVSRYVPAVEPWDGPTDGSWERGDYALGETIRGHELLAGSLSSDYEITVTAPPTFTTTDGGEWVTMTSPLEVTRVQDLGYGQSFTESERIFFETESRPESEKYNEAWGTRPSIECEHEEIAVGEGMTCTVSFGTTSDAVVDSYWQINGKNAAAWPGQTP